MPLFTRTPLYTPPHESIASDNSHTTVHPHTIASYRPCSRYILHYTSKKNMKGAFLGLACVLIMPNRGGVDKNTPPRPVPTNADVAGQGPPAAIADLCLLGGPTVEAPSHHRTSRQAERDRIGPDLGEHTRELLQATTTTVILRSNHAS